MKSPPDPWRVFEILAETPATLYEWRQRLGPFEDAVRELLIASPTGDLLRAPCSRCGRYAPLLPLSGSDQFRVIHDYDVLCDHVTSVAPEEASVYRLHIGALAGALRPLLSLTTPPATDLTATPELVGYCAGPGRRPVFLLLHARPTPALTRALQVLHSAGIPPVLLLLRHRGYVQHHLSPSSAQALDLASYVTWTQTGMHADSQAFQKALSEHAPLAVGVSGVGAAVAALTSKFDALAQEHTTLRVENEQLKGAATTCFTQLARKVSPDDFRIFAAILTGGTVAQASRILKMKDSTLRSQIDQWAARGPSYKLMLDLVGWRKTVGRKISTAFDERWVTGEVSPATTLPDAITDAINALHEQNPANWKRVRDEVLQLLNDERRS